MNKFKQDSLRTMSDLKELPVKFIVNSCLETELICTPNKLEELALGWISSTICNITLKDVIAVHVCKQKAQVQISLKQAGSLCKQSFSQSVVEAIEQICQDDSSAIPQKQTVDIAKIQAAAQKLNAMRSKGLHGALCYNNKTFVYCEDISRHCAVDKAIGSMIKLEMDMHTSVLLTTGRISSELLWKAKLAKIPVIASLKYPSETGILLSNAWGIAIASKVLSEDIAIY